LKFWNTWVEVTYIRKYLVTETSKCFKPTKRNDFSVMQKPYSNDYTLKNK